MGENNAERKQRSYNRKRRQGDDSLATTDKSSVPIGSAAGTQRHFTIATAEGKVVSQANQPFDEKSAQSMESKLLAIFSMVSDWLKFAEAKNAGLLVFSGAAVAAILSLLGSSLNLSPYWRAGLLSSVVLLLVCSLTTLYSFLPKTKLDKILLARKGLPLETDNLYFYGDVCKYSREELADAIGRFYFPSLSTEKIRTRNHLDIAAQIVANSQIAMRKYNLFKIALWSAVLAIFATPVGALIWYAIKHLMALQAR